MDDNESDMSVNLPNLVTLARVPMVFLIMVLMWLPAPGTASAALVLYILAGVSDWLDGYLARRYQMVSTFGKFMDSLTDKIFVLGTLVALVGMPDSPMPGWTCFLIVIILTREFMVTGLRMIAVNKGVVLSAERAGKVKMVLQLVSTGFFILALVVRSDLSGLFGEATGRAFWVVQWTGIVLLLLTTFLTIQSGFSYLRNYAYLLKDDV